MATVNNQNDPNTYKDSLFNCLCCACGFFIKNAYEFQFQEPWSRIWSVGLFDASPGCSRTGIVDPQAEDKDKELRSKYYTEQLNIKKFAENQEKYLKGDYETDNYNRLFTVYLTDEQLKAFKEKKLTGSYSLSLSAIGNSTITEQGTKEYTYYDDNYQPRKGIDGFGWTDKMSASITATASKENIRVTKSTDESLKSLYSYKDLEPLYDSVDEVIYNFFGSTFFYYARYYWWYGYYYDWYFRDIPANSSEVRRVNAAYNNMPYILLLNKLSDNGMEVWYSQDQKQYWQTYLFKEYEYYMDIDRRRYGNYYLWYEWYSTWYLKRPYVNMCTRRRYLLAFQDEQDPQQKEIQKQNKIRYTPTCYLISFTCAAQIQESRSFSYEYYYYPRVGEDQKRSWGDEGSYSSPMQSMVVEMYFFIDSKVETNGPNYGKTKCHFVLNHVTEMLNYLSYRNGDYAFDSFLRYNNNPPEPEIEYFSWPWWGWWHGGYWYSGWSWGGWAASGIAALFPIGPVTAKFIFNFFGQTFNFNFSRYTTPPILSIMKTKSWQLKWYRKYSTHWFSGYYYNNTFAEENRASYSGGQNASSSCIFTLNLKEGSI